MNSSPTSRLTENSLLNILMVVPQYPYPVVGGFERQAHELTKVLLKEQFNVLVLSGKIYPAQETNDEVEGVNVYRFPLPQNKFIRFITTPFYLASALIRKRKHYDVIHLHQYSWFGLFVILLSKVLTKPILTKLPNDGRYGIVAVKKTKLGWLKVKIVKMSDAVVAMTKATLTEVDAIGFSLKRTLFVHNGINLDCNSTHALQKPSRNSKVCNVVFVGGLREQKGVKDLLYAWKKVTSNTEKPVQLEIWGSGELDEYLRALSQELAVDDTVIFRGQVESVREKLSDMDIFVLPSLGEGNSNAILEAMAAKLPIVTTNVGGASLQVGVEGLRFLVEPGDQDGISKHLLELIEDENLRNELGVLMYRRVSSEFDIYKIASSYIDAYKCLVSGRREKVGEIGNTISVESQI